MCEPGERGVGGKTHVATGAVQLAVVLDVEVNDIDSTAAIVLDDFVAGVVGTTADDPRFLAGLVVLDGDGILAYVLEPNKLEVAGAVTVHALSLVLANDNVSQGCAGSEQENGIRVS